MNSFSMAYKLFKTNMRTYGYYLAVMIFAVAVYYDFTFLKYNSRVMETTEMSQMAKSASVMTSFIMLVFLFFFMWYSSSFFLKQRKKEIGIYLLSGVENRKIALVFAAESLLMGAMAILCGLALGILLSKLFMMALAKVILLKVTIPFAIPLNSVADTALTFAVIFICLSVGSYISVARSKLIDLITSSRKQESEPKLKLVRGILSLLLIGTGYYMSMSPKFYLYGVVIVALVVWGTYWLFGSLFSCVLRDLLSRKEILYKGPRLISISNITFRLKSNYRGLAMICVLVATTITAFGTSLSLKYYADQTQRVQSPYSFSWVTRDESLSQQAITAIHESDHPITLYEEIKYVNVDSAVIKGLEKFSGSLCVVGYSEFSRVAHNLHSEDALSLLDRMKQSDSQAICIPAPDVIGSTLDYTGRELVIGNISLTVMETAKTPLFGSGALGGKTSAIVSDATYNLLKDSYPVLTFTGIIVEDAENSLALSQLLYGIMPKEAGFWAYAAEYKSTLSIIGLFYFLGTFMSVVFILAIGSIMYFKLLSEALADKVKYEILGKIGMSRDELKQAVSLQVGMSLALPLVIGIIHSIFAIGALEKVLSISLTLPTLAAVGIFSLIYGVFYLAITNKFVRLVIVPERS